MVCLLFIVCSLSLIHPSPPPFSAANLIKPGIFTHSEPTPLLPTTFFQVSKPIPLPNTKPCSYLVFQHNFNNTYGRPPVLANYKPPSHCPSHKFSRIVLEWNATCKGKQFDRIFGVWLGGVEILRSCTAEPTARGIFWTVKKDITRYHSLLMSNQTVAVYLGNVVNSKYTGVYHVNVTFHFYPVEKQRNSHSEPVADLIMPISRTLPLNDGLWFEIENSTDVELKVFKIPRNVYRAVLEVYVSFHENDEFWYGNYPNEYISANNLTGTSGNGPFREVVVRLDGRVVSAIWPFTVIYTGGLNPLFWRPITGIGSFDLPSYDIEITPFLGELLDGESHELAFSVTNALNVWYIDANLHLWLDKKSGRTQGKLVEYKESPLLISTLSNFTGLDGLSLTYVTRSIVSRGWVKSSHINETTESLLKLEYTNAMVMGKDGNQQIVNQVIKLNSNIDTCLNSTKSHTIFVLHFLMDNTDRGNGSFESVADVRLGFDVEKKKASVFGVSKSRVKSLQHAEGNMVVKGSSLVSGLGSTQQDYSYTNDQSCYFRNVSSSNYTLLHDEEGNTCKSHG